MNEVNSGGTNILCANDGELMAYYIELLEFNNKEMVHISDNDLFKKLIFYIL